MAAVSSITPAAGAGAAAPPVPDCTVCLEKCNKSTRKTATCPYCSESVCRACIQTYLLQDQAADHRCPSCRAVWNDEFLTTTLTGVFRHGPLKEHRAKILLDMEKARLPDFQEQARAYLNAKELDAQMRPLYDAAKNKLTRARSKHYKLTREYEKTPIADTEKREKLREAITRAQTAIGTAQHEYDARRTEYTPVAIRLRHFGAAPGNGAAAPAPAGPRIWRSKCPGARCEGFLGDDYKCGLCDLQACKECHEATAEGHVCNADTLASVRAVMKEARPCPKCAAMISKIDGCDQMWCTQCKTAFSWITGNIETTVVHNPHYYQWMRETGQVIPRTQPAGAVPPGGPCGITAIETWFQNNGFVRHSMFSFLREIGHIEARKLRPAEGTLRMWRNPDRTSIRCVCRLVNELTDDAWMDMIEKEQKILAIYQASVQFHQMCVQVQTALFGRVLELDPALSFEEKEKAVNNIYTELKLFMKYRQDTARKLRLTHRAENGTFYGENGYISE